MHAFCCLLIVPHQFVFLQGEHGTGRNVAPFVEMEWGSKAYDLMWELKALFDPNFVLNPGVVLNKVTLSHSDDACLAGTVCSPAGSAGSVA